MIMSNLMNGLSFITKKTRREKIVLLVRPVEYPTVSYIMSDPATEPFS